MAVATVGTSLLQRGNGYFVEIYFSQENCNFRCGTIFKLENLRSFYFCE